MLVCTRSRGTRKQWSSGLAFILLLTSAETIRVVREIQRSRVIQARRNQTGNLTTSQLDKAAAVDQLILLGGLMCVLAVTNTANAVVTQRRLAAARHVMTQLEDVQSKISIQRAAQCVQFRHTMLHMLAINIEMSSFVQISAALHAGDAAWVRIVETTTSTVKEMHLLFEEQAAYSCYSLDEGEVQLAKDTAKVKGRIDKLGSKLYGDVLRALMSFMLVAQNVKLNEKFHSEAKRKDPSSAQGYDKLPSKVQNNIQNQYNSAISEAGDAVQLAESSFVTLQENAKSAGMNSVSVTILFTLYTVMWSLIMADVDVPIPAEVGLISSYLGIVRNGIVLYVQLKDGGASRSELMITELQLLQSALAAFQTTITFSGGALIPGMIQIIAVLSIVTSTIALIANTLQRGAERKEYAEMLERSEDTFVQFKVGASYKACNTLALTDQLAEVRESVLRAIPLEELEISGQLAEEVVSETLGQSVEALCERAPRLCFDIMQHESMPEVVIRAYGAERMMHLRELVTRGPISDIAVYTNQDERILMESFGFADIYPGVMACRACSRDLVVDLAVHGVLPQHDARCCCSEKEAGRCLSIPKQHTNVFGHCPTMTLNNKPIELHHQDSGCDYDDSIDLDFMRQRLDDFDKPTDLKFVRLPDWRILGLYTQTDAQIAVTEFEQYLAERSSSDHYFDLHLSIEGTLRSHDWQMVATLQPPRRLKESSRAVFSGLIAKKRPISPSLEVVRDPSRAAHASPASPASQTSPRKYGSIAVTVGACRLDSAWREHATILWDLEQIALPPLSDPSESTDLWAVEDGFNVSSWASWVNAPQKTTLQTMFSLPQATTLQACSIQKLIPLGKPSYEVKVSSVHDIMRGFRFPGESIIGWHTKGWVREGMMGGQEATCCCSEYEPNQCDWATNLCPKLEYPDGTPLLLAKASSEHCHGRDSRFVYDWEQVSAQIKSLHGHNWKLEDFFIVMAFKSPELAESIERQFAFITSQAELEPSPATPMTSADNTLGSYSPNVAVHAFRNFKKAPVTPGVLASKKQFGMYDLREMSLNVMTNSLNFREQSLQELDSPKCSFADQSIQNALRLLLPDVLHWEHTQAIPELGHGMVITDLRSDLDGMFWDSGECQDSMVTDALVVKETATHVFSLPTPLRRYYANKYASSRSSNVVTFENAVASWASWNARILKTESDTFKIEGTLKETAKKIARASCLFQATWHLPVNRSACAATVLSNAARFARVGVDVVNGAIRELCLGHQDALAVDSYVVQWSGGIKDDFGLPGSLLRQAGFVLLSQQNVNAISDLEYPIRQLIWIRYDPRVGSTEYNKASIRSALHKVKRQKLDHLSHVARLGTRPVRRRKI